MANTYQFSVRAAAGPFGSEQNLVGAAVHLKLFPQGSPPVEDRLLDTNEDGVAWTGSPINSRPDRYYCAVMKAGYVTSTHEGEIDWYLGADGNWYADVCWLTVYLTPSP